MVHVNQSASVPTQGRAPSLAILHFILEKVLGLLPPCSRLGYYKHAPELQQRHLHLRKSIPRLGGQMGLGVPTSVLSFGILFCQGKRCVCVWWKLAQAGPEKEWL